MRFVTDEWVCFEESDMAFMAKFGIDEATQMALNFKALNEKLPFIFDTFQLAHFLRLKRNDLFNLVKNADKQYRKICLKKKNGKSRVIHAPDHSLKTVQKIILREILMQFSASEYATAYVRRKSLRNNASPHVGKRYILKLDITDFFGSIRFDQVYSAVFNTRYFPKQIGVMLTALCCRNEVLPQGAPTSPALSNLVFRNFDNNIGRWCKEHGIAYTRYCDDMTFSSDSSLFPVYQKVKNMLEETSFELNEKKTRFISNACRQSVTGLTVNEKVTVSRDYKRRLRQEVYYAIKFGLPNTADPSRQSEEDAYYHLVGKIRYVLQIEPDNRWFLNALKQLEQKKL